MLGALARQLPLMNISRNFIENKVFCGRKYFHEDMPVTDKKCDKSLANFQTLYLMTRHRQSRNHEHTTTVLNPQHEQTVGATRTWSRYRWHHCRLTYRPTKQGLPRAPAQRLRGWSVSPSRTGSARCISKPVGYYKE